MPNEGISNRLLTGIRVIDMTRILSGPYCTMILKNLGAEIIKMERPLIGDESRYIGPFLGDNTEKSAYFMSVNAGKRSVSVELKQEEGKRILTGLMQKSDVLIENYRPGTLERLGFSQERIKEINPQLIYATISGFGWTGPESQKPAFDMIIQALSGLISITGTDDGRTARVGTSISDIIGGMYAAVGIVAALYKRERHPSGSRLDISMLDSTVSILENAVARYQVTGVNPRPIGSRHPSVTPFGTFTTKDSEIVIAAGNDKLFGDLCDLLERPDLKQDARFTTNQLRTQNVAALKAIINEITSRHATDWWLDAVTQAGIPCSKVNSIEDLFHYKQVIDRNMLIPIEGEDGFKIVGNPIKIKGVPDVTESEKPPEIGQHNDYVLREILGYGSDEISKLYESGVLYKKEKKPAGRN